MLTNSVQSRAGASHYPSRTSSVPCVMPSRRRNHDLTLLGLEAVALGDSSRRGNCHVDQGILGSDRRPRRAAGLYKRPSSAS